MIIDHTHPEYVRWKNMVTVGRQNGAYHYSREIVRNIIPNVETDRNWMTINLPETGIRYLDVPKPGTWNHSIVFIHNNLHPDHYLWLKRFEDLILVCGIPETCEKVAHLGTPIYLPLSVDVAEVSQYKCEKTMDVAFVGRKPKRKGITFPENTDFIENLPRNKLLKKMARYRYVFAVGRTAIEARVLDCNLLAYDPRFPDVNRWQVLDNKDAAKILQEKLWEIDGR